MGSGKDNRCMPPPPPPSLAHQSPNHRSGGNQVRTLQPIPIRPKPLAMSHVDPLMQSRNPLGIQPISKPQALDLSSGSHFQNLGKRKHQSSCQPSTSQVSNKIDTKPFILSPSKYNMTFNGNNSLPVTCKKEQSDFQDKSCVSRNGDGNEGNSSFNMSDVLHSAHNTVYQQDTLPADQKSKDSQTNPAKKANSSQRKSSDMPQSSYSMSSILEMPVHIKSEPTCIRPAKTKPSEAPYSNRSDISKDVSKDVSKDASKDISKGLEVSKSGFATKVSSGGTQTNMPDVAIATVAQPNRPGIAIALPSKSSLANKSGVAIALPPGSTQISLPPGTTQMKKPVAIALPPSASQVNRHRVAIALPNQGAFSNVLKDGSSVVLCFPSPQHSIAKQGDKSQDPTKLVTPHKKIKLSTDVAKDKKVVMAQTAKKDVSSDDVIVIDDSDDTSDDEPLVNLIKSKQKSSGENKDKISSVCQQSKSVSLLDPKKTISLLKLNNKPQEPLRKSNAQIVEISKPKGSDKLKKPAKVEDEVKRIKQLADESKKTKTKTLAKNTPKPTKETTVLNTKLKVKKKKPDSNVEIRKGAKSEKKEISDVIHSKELATVEKSSVSVNVSDGENKTAIISDNPPVSSTLKKAVKVNKAGPKKVTSVKPKSRTKKRQSSTSLLQSPVKVNANHGWSWVGRGEMKPIPKVTTVSYLLIGDNLLFLFILRIIYYTLKVCHYQSKPKGF